MQYEFTTAISSELVVFTLLSVTKSYVHINGLESLPDISYPYGFKLAISNELSILPLQSVHPCVLFRSCTQKLAQSPAVVSQLGVMHSQTI